MIQYTVTTGLLLNFSQEVRRAKLAERKALHPTPNFPNTIPGHYSDERYALDKKRKDLTLTSLPTNVEVNTEAVEDYVAIIDIDAYGPDKGINLIRLPFIPKELNWNTDSSFATIKPLGRNNPRYQFTGSEDNLEFEIDWHSYSVYRDDVIKNCRYLESLSKADSYNNPPHRVLLKWGLQDVLFRDMVFIVKSAPYKMVQFNKSQKMGGQIFKTGMLPVQATQNVVLSRITENNLSTKDIQFVGSYSGL